VGEWYVILFNFKLYYFQLKHPSLQEKVKANKNNNSPSVTNKQEKLSFSKKNNISKQKVSTYLPIYFLHLLNLIIIFNTKLNIP